MTITAQAGSKQGINALKNGVQIGGTTFYTGSGSPSAYAVALRIGDLYVDYTNGAMYIAGATGSGGWTPFAGLDSVTSLSVTATSAAYNNSALNVGKYGAGIADTLTADNILVSFVNKSGVNKTGADTSSMTLYVGNSTTAAVTNNKMQGILSSMTIAHNVFDAYAGQFHISITATMATQAGNANLVGLACKANIANSVTATGNVSALYVVLDSGSGDTATGQYDMIRMENNATNCDNAIDFGDCTHIASLFYMNAAGCVTAETGAIPENSIYKIKVNIAGVPAYIPLVADY
jgi:hypothetical protein